MTTLLIAAATAALVSAVGVFIHLRLARTTHQACQEQNRITAALKRTAETARQLRGFSHDIDGLRRACRGLAAELNHLEESPTNDTFRRCMDAAGELRVHHNKLWEVWAAMKAGGQAPPQAGDRLWQALTPEDKNQLWNLLDDVHTGTVGVEAYVDQLQRMSESRLNSREATDLIHHIHKWLDQLMPKVDRLFSHVVRNSVFLKQLPEEES